VELILTPIFSFVGGREGKASKQASRATPATQLQQKHMAMPLQTSLEPPTKSRGDGGIG